MNLYTLIYLALTLFVLYLFFTLGMPFLLAIVIALLIEPLVGFLTKIFLGKRVIASLLTCTGVLIGAVVGMYALGDKAIRELISLTKWTVEYVKNNYDQIVAYVMDVQETVLPFTQELDLQLTDFVKTGIDSLQSIVLGVSNALIGLIQGVPGLILDTLIFIIAFYLISLGMPKIKDKILHLFDDDSHHKIEHLMQKLYKAVFGFIGAQLIMSLLIFILTLGGLLILGVPLPFATAGIVTVVDILPVLGTGSVVVPLSIYYIIQGNYFIAVGLLILYGVLFAFRRVVEPKVLGDAIGVGALSALASMYIGIKLVGFVGLFLGPSALILINALISADILKIKIKV